MLTDNFNDRIYDIKMDIIILFSDELLNNFNSSLEQLFIIKETNSKLYEERFYDLLNKMPGGMKEIIKEYMEESKRIYKIR